MKYSKTASKKFTKSFFIVLTFLKNEKIFQHMNLSLKDVVFVLRIYSDKKTTYFRGIKN